MRQGEENKTPKCNSRTLGVAKRLSGGPEAEGRPKFAQCVFPWHKRDILNMKRKKKNAAFGFHGLVCSYGLASFCMCSLVTKDSKSIGICIHSKSINSKSGLRELALGLKDHRTLGT